jgi:hypothetical protein
MADAVRLIFSHDGDELRLVSQQRVDVAIDDVDASPVRHPGYFVELRGEDNDMLGRVRAHNAFNTSIEVFPENPGEPITRVETELPTGAFTVVLPVTKAAKQIAVVHLSPAPVGPQAFAPGPIVAAPAAPEMSEIATFPVELD